MDRSETERIARSIWPATPPPARDHSAPGARPVVWLVGPFHLYPAAVEARLRGAFRTVRVRRFSAGTAVWPGPDVVVVPPGTPRRDRVLAALRGSPAASGAPVVHRADADALAAALRPPPPGSPRG